MQIRQHSFSSYGSSIRSIQLDNHLLWKALARSAHDTKGVILDLRGNRGGNSQNGLESAEYLGAGKRV